MDGIKLLGKLGVPEARQEDYVDAVKGHALALRALGWCFEQHRLDKRPEVALNAALRECLASESDYSKRIISVLEFYLKTEPVENQRVLQSIAIHPRAVDVGTISAIAHISNAEVSEILNGLRERGVVQKEGSLGRPKYSLHPLLRSVFRPRDEKLSDEAAGGLLKGRPEGFVPRTLEECMPSVEAIRLYLDGGHFKKAANILARNLAFGDRLSEFGGAKYLRECLLPFFVEISPDPLGSDSDDATAYDFSHLTAAEGKLGAQFITAILPRLHGASAALGYWDEAKLFAKLDRSRIDPDDKSAEILILFTEARVAAAIGDLDEAICLYERIIEFQEAGSESTFALLDLAEAFGNYGLKAKAIECANRWILTGPKGSGLSDWLNGWQRLCAVVSSALYRTNKKEARRFRNATGQTLLEDDEDAKSLREFIWRNSMKTGRKWSDLRVSLKHPCAPTETRNTRRAGCAVKQRR